MAIGVFLARTIPTNADPHSLELANLRRVQESGRRVLEELVPLRTPGSLTTIPALRGPLPLAARTLRKQERDGLERSLEFADDLPFPEPTTTTRRRAGERAPRAGAPTGGSYMVAIREGRGRCCSTVPSSGFCAPERIYELEVHGPDLDVRGITAPGRPVIGAGFNRHVAWGITTGASDADDLYAEQLVDGDDERYVFKGEEREMDCRDEQIDYDTPPSDLLGGNVPRRPAGGQRARCGCAAPCTARSRPAATAWPTRAATRSGAASWRRSRGWPTLNEAQDIDDVDRAVRTFTWNENVMAVDSDGNIGFWHPGLLPAAPARWDERLPYPGTGEAEWRGLLDRDDQMPFVINPKQGWLANWNNLPSRGWTSGDGTARKRMDGRLFRVGLLFRLVRAPGRRPFVPGACSDTDPQEAGTTAQQPPLARSTLRRAARGADGEAAEGPAHGAALGRLLPPHRRRRHRRPRRRRVGRLAGRAARHGRERAGRGCALGGGRERPQLPRPRLQRRRRLPPLRHPPPGGVRAAHAGARAARATPPSARSRSSRTRFDSERPATTGASRGALYDVPVLGAEAPADLPFFDRGTWEQFVELGP